MNLLQSLVLGVVEGLTEFLPISSTFHLLFATKLLQIPTTEFSKFFDVFIQVGAILPVVFLYGLDWLKNLDFSKKIALSFVPTAIIGFILHKVIKDVFFESSGLMIGAFVVIGIVFLVVEWLVRKGKLPLERSIADLTLVDAIIIGIAQALAVVPGVSRAGAVIVAMMLLRVRRDEAAKYSFSLGVPTIIAAAALDTFQMRHNMSAVQGNLGMLSLGFLAAFVSSFLMIKWFIAYLRSHSLSVFGIYRFAIGGVLLLLFH